MNSANSPATDTTRALLVKTLRESEDVCASVIGNANAYRRFFSVLGLEGASELYHVLEFAASVKFDLDCLTADFFLNEQTPRSHVYSRFIILTIYESTKTYGSLLGKRLQAKLSSEAGSVHFLQRARAAHKELNAVARQAERTYGDVRDGIAAHRDPEALMQLERLHGIGGEELALFVTQFSKAHGVLLELLQDVSHSVRRALAQHMNPMFLMIGATSTVSIDLEQNDSQPSMLVDNKSLSWSTDDPDVATVGTDGQVVAVGGGHTRVAFRSLTNEAVWGGAFVFVGTEEELSAYAELWQKAFAGPIS